MPRRTQAASSSTLEERESMASMARSGSGSSSVSTVAASMKARRGSTRQSGLMSRIRAAATSTLGRPRVECRANSWRLRLVALLPS